MDLAVTILCVFGAGVVVGMWSMPRTLAKMLAVDQRIRAERKLLDAQMDEMVGLSMQIGDAVKESHRIGRELRRRL